MSLSCNSGIFGPTGKHIKNQDGAFVAINGANIDEKLDISDLKMPYDQVSKQRICIDPGKSCMIGDTCGSGAMTFLAIKAIYSDKITHQEDKHVEWYFRNKHLCKDNMSELMVLTGTESKPISPVVLTNPSDKYKVCFEIMIGLTDGAEANLELYVDLGYVDLGYVAP